MHCWSVAWEVEAFLRKGDLPSESPMSHHLGSFMFFLHVFFQPFVKEVPKSPASCLFCSVDQQELTLLPASYRKPSLNFPLKPNGEKRTFWGCWKNSPNCPLITEILYGSVSQSIEAAITKCLSLGGLQTEIDFFIVLESGKPKIMAPAGLVSSEGLFLAHV